MATNEILTFSGTDTGTNLLTQSEYSSDAQRPIGNQPGIARAKLVNKVLRQASLMSAALAQFLADNQSNNITDLLSSADIAGYIKTAMKALGLPSASAAGTADAITATFSPAITLSNSTTVIVRAAAANTTTTPTFAPNSLTAKTIVKNSNAALAAGDIAGAGHWLILTYDGTLDKWVLDNPKVQSNGGTVTSVATSGLATGGTITGSGTIGVPAATQSDQETGTSTSVAITPGVQKYHPSAAKAWVLFNGSTNTILASYNVSSVTKNATGDYTVNYTTSFSSSNYAVVSTAIDTSIVMYSNSSPYAASSTRIYTVVRAGTSNQDASLISLVAFGDQ